MSYSPEAGAVSRYFRARRMAMFSKLFRLTGVESIIDIGGYESHWGLLNSAPRVLLVNLEEGSWERGRFRKVRGDARALDYADHAFDIAYSNSVVEHVGAWEDQQAFASEVSRLAPRYFVQTPYKHFPLEVHYLVPGLQYAPKWLLKGLVRWLTPMGWIARPTRRWIEDFVDCTRLLDRREFSLLFPDAEIFEETFLGLTKSLIAVRL